MSCQRFILLLAVLSLTPVLGCRSDPPPRTGFLSDYKNLEQIDQTTYRFVSREIAAYTVFVIDPVELRVQESDTRLTEAQLNEAAAYFLNRLTEAFGEAGLATLPGQSYMSYPPGTLRFRIAITDARSATLLLNLHPGSKLTGAGTGGAAMEGEIVESATGRQLAAFVQSGRGSQFEFDQFNRLDDIKDVIDGWAQEIVDDLIEARQSHEAS